MSQVFISYSHEDKPKATAMAAALEAAGHTVWWDNELLPGDRFAATLAERIDRAEAVVVMWSRTSIQSDYVCDEADRARIAGRLTPVLIDAVRPPVGFGQLHTHDLSGWSGAAEDPVLIDFASRLLTRNQGGARPAPTPLSSPQTAQDRRSTWPVAAGLGAIAIALGAYFMGQSDLLSSAQAEDSRAACTRLAGPSVDWDTLTGHSVEAITACEAAVAAGATPKLHYLLGRAYDTGGDFDGAIRNYTIGANGGDLSALDSLCESLAYDKLPEAKEWCQKAVDAGIAGAKRRLDSL